MEGMKSRKAMEKGAGRGGVRKDRRVARPVTVWFRKEEHGRMREAAERLDTDCSKFVRGAVREKCERVLGKEGDGE